MSKKSKGKDTPAEGTQVAQAPRMIELGGRKHRPGSRYTTGLRLALTVGSGKVTQGEFTDRLQSELGITRSTARNWAPQMFRELKQEFKAAAKQAEDGADGQA